MFFSKLVVVLSVAGCLPAFTTPPLPCLLFCVPDLRLVYLLLGHEYLLFWLPMQVGVGGCGHLYFLISYLNSNFCVRKALGSEERAVE